MNNLRLLIILAVGAVVGSVVNELLAGAGAPLWLVRVLPMGLEPTTLDLNFLKLTVGLTLQMSFGSVLGMLIALIAFHKRV